MIAIAYGADWRGCFMSAADILGRENKLVNELDTALCRVNTVVLIDELDRFFENSPGAYMPSKQALILEAFLGKHRNNQKIFLIGTIDQANRLPASFNHRFGGNMICFNPIRDSNKLMEILKDVVQRNDKLGLDECRDNDIKRCIETFQKKKL